MKKFFRRKLDQLAPSMTSNLRWLRDFRKTRSSQVIKTTDGLQLYTSDLDDPSKREADEANVFKSFLSVCSVVVDVGANIGYFSCIAAKLGTRAIAIEPNPFNAQILLRNVEANLLVDRVQVFPVAVSAAPGILPLFGGGTGASLREGWAGVKGSYRQLVPILTLDIIVSGVSHADRCLVKIDVEGHEADALSGAHSLFSRTPKPVVMIESHVVEPGTSTTNKRFLEVADFFFSRGYQGYRIESKLIPFSLDDAKRWIGGKEPMSHIGINFIFCDEEAFKQARQG